MRPHFNDSHFLGIIVPYRDRETHLKKFVEHMNAFLIKAKRNFEIFVIEQSGTKLFNRGALFNAGFYFAKLAGCDCIHVT